MNRKTFVLLASIVIAAVAIAGVFRFVKYRPDRPDNATLRAALESYLAQRSGLNMSGMDMVIKNVKMEGNHAEAQVEFRAKQGDAQMQVTYQFVRQGKAWVVQGSSGTTGSGHPAIPEGAPPSQPGTLPPGHPPVHGSGNPPPTKD